MFCLACFKGKGGGGEEGGGALAVIIMLFLFLLGTQRMYVWWSLCTLHLVAWQVTIGSSGLCCCICVTSFERWLTPFCVAFVVDTWCRTRFKSGTWTGKGCEVKWEHPEWGLRFAVQSPLTLKEWEGWGGGGIQGLVKDILNNSFTHAHRCTHAHTHTLSDTHTLSLSLFLSLSLSLSLTLKQIGSHAETFRWRGLCF